MRSKSGTKLDVGDNVIKNQKIENETIGSLRLKYQPKDTIRSNTSSEAMTPGSTTLTEGRTSWSTFNPAGQKGQKIILTYCTMTRSWVRK